MMWGGPGGYGMNWGFGFIFMILFWIILIIGVVLLIRWLILQAKGESSYGVKEDSALEILKKRYAKGEISKEEFEEKKKDLL